MSTVQENIRKLQELLSKYSNNLKLLRSEGDIDSIDMDIMMKSVNQDFMNSDPNMPKFVSGQLALGNEVAVLPAGKDKLMIFSAQGLFKK